MMTNDKHLDYDALNALKDVMEDDFLLLIETFLADSKGRVLTLQSLKNSTDSDAIRRAAHSFKGSCSNLGVLHLASLCGSVEHKALGANVENFAEDLRCIEEEFVLVQKMLADYLQ
ncbi:MAG: Hpt domain-containing protein [Pseudomonadota bacterium]